MTAMLALLLLLTNCSNLMSITCVVSAVVVQPISLQPSTNVSRACGTDLLLLSVDMVVLTVKLKIPDASYTVAENGTHFRQISTGGRIKVLCIPPMGQCSLGLVQLEQKNCACISLHNETYTLVLRQVASLDMNGSVIDFVWRFNSSSLFISEDHYKVPPVTITCFGFGQIIYISPRFINLALVGLLTGLNLLLVMIGCFALRYFYKKDYCWVRSCCERCCEYLRVKCCSWNPLCKDKTQGDADSASSGGSEDSGQSEAPAQGTAEAAETAEPDAAEHEHVEESASKPAEENAAPPASEG
ncbi:hypothetical protein ElyMa_003510100 [Elysia marginata]|uniref:Uncharacterized protein n=1 Tax=Elysia marginata TaxID=1093978 RepID=A0AAV4EEY3_9GAST|nr:hypothetical protein ElyMa_003510100 [Elysia marginata]